MIQKLRLKFIVINMSIVTIMLGIILGLIYYFTIIDIETGDLSMMLEISDEPSRLIVPGNSPDNARLPFFVLKQESDNSLNAIGSYFDLTDYEFLNEIFTIALESESNTGVIDKYLLRYLRVGTLSEQTVVFLDISSETSMLNNLIKSCAIIGVFSFLIFLALSLFLARWATAPIDRAWKQQQQFVADASHELKTPITVIMTNAELMLNTDYNKAEQIKFTDAILIMSKQMKTLVEQLLELAKADNVRPNVVFGKTDLSRLISDALLPFEPVFFEKGLTVSTDIENGIFIAADENKLRQVIDILLDNAQKYSHNMGTTWIKLCCKGKSKALLSVSNEGDEISQDELKNIFKRFYRIDKARSRDGSFGLGLSIADTIVAMHKGKIWAESRNGINTFYVELRLSEKENK